MPRLSHRLAAVGSFAVLTVLGSRPAFAQDPPSEDALPALPNPDSAPVRPSNTGGTVTSRSDIPVVQAGVVQTNRVETVVVAEPGSNVTVPTTVHDRSHRDYAPDPGRKAALIASPIVFGVGGLVSGIAYLGRGETCDSSFNSQTGTSSYNCHQASGTGALWTYNIIVAAVPSTPRWVVGDVLGALVYTGARSASVVLASTIDWGHDNSSWLGPFMLGVLAPLTLGIVDLATTPHREDLVSKDDGKANEAKAPSGFQISSIAPTTLSDPEHKVNGAMLNLSATF